MQQHVSSKYAFIDALRGYAVLLVITCHVGGAFDQLPYPIRKLANFGWHGVQLFFLISCVTLLMSWRSDERRGTTNTGAFWARRFFRIAPMYYLAALLYLVVEPPVSGFDLPQLLSSLLFVNSWSPWLVPTVPNRWTVVPGGWSIGVEFTFYMVFPLLAWRIRSFRGALMAFVAAVIVGMVVNTYARPGLLVIYGNVATDNFLYFWFINQLPIFMLGFVLYYAIRYFQQHDDAPIAAALRHWRYPAVGLCGLGLIVLAEQTSYRVSVLSLAPLGPFPMLMLASFVFMGFALLLFLNPTMILVNRVICALGEVSFSAYLLHFMVLHQLTLQLPSLFDRTATGLTAVFTFAALWVVTVPITFGLSVLTFRAVEAPMIRLGRRLLERWASLRLMRQARLAVPK